MKTQTLKLLAIPVLLAASTIGYALETSLDAGVQLTATVGTGEENIANTSGTLTDGSPITLSPNSLAPQALGKTLDFTTPGASCDLTVWSSDTVNGAISGIPFKLKNGSNELPFSVTLTGTRTGATGLASFSSTFSSSAGLGASRSGTTCEIHLTNETITFNRPANLPVGNYTGYLRFKTTYSNS